MSILDNKENHLYQGDFSQGLVEPLRQHEYDFIVSSYAFHHLTDEQKIGFIEELLNHLKSDGLILIGDAAFENRAQLEQCRNNAGADWDDEEIYVVIDELKKTFPKLSFSQVSYCAGVLTFRKSS